MTNMPSDIVISGFSGRFPESNNVEEFTRNLFEGVDMVTRDDRRWPPGTMGLPERNGKLKNLEMFDASFFGVHAKQADKMDPQLRILLEVTHEAIIDAGINPAELRGSNTGVFVGVGMAESDDYFTSDPDKINGYEALGCCRSMFANRVSYSFDFNGPSFVLDAACSSSIYALHQAVLAMRAGECDSAIVGGVSVDLKPNTSLCYHRLNMLSPDGKCKAFDADGNGYVRSEAVAAIFLQKYSNAKRVYASIINTKTNVDGYKDQGITFPSGEMQLKLLKNIYKEAAIDPREVSYVEAHGTGTKAGDPQEVNTIAEFFCKYRSFPLLIGSVKSNMGHSEAASGICSIAKVLISMAYKTIPRNLHFKTPNSDIPALFDRRLKVVDQNTTWEGGLIGLNSLGAGGANAHVILKSFSKRKSKITYSNLELPRIVGVSARTLEACQLMLENINKHKNDSDFIGLVHNINKQSIRGCNYRGFSIFSDVKVKEIGEVESVEKRPVWYIFAGLGTQWPKCGSELMSIPVFSESINRSAEYVKQFGLDLVYLINNSEEKDLEDVIKSLVLITAIQVGLVDLLSFLGICPDGIIGLSAGEMACAYADRSLTQEQTILSSYWRAKIVQESEIIEGEMVAVGLSKEEVRKICPDDIDLAVHTEADNVTIAGPKESVKKFNEELIAKGIFTKALKTSGIAFHSRYIAKAGEKLKLRMDKIIPYPKRRSSKWLSSSVQKAYWGTELDRYCNGDYFVNNFLLPVYFYETLQNVPANAITIEIAPHWTLRSVIRKSLTPTNLHLALHKKFHTNNMEFLMTNLGRLFNAGIDVDFSKLYPPIEFPVGSGTPMFNSLVGWDHTQKWTVPNFTESKRKSGHTTIVINLAEEEYKYLRGIHVDGNEMFPPTGYLFLVWQTFAKIHGIQFEQLPVVLENINLLRAMTLSKENSIKLLINILIGTGDFEVCEGNTLLVSGRVHVPEKRKNNLLLLPEYQDATQGLLNLYAVDFYKELRLRGFEFSGDFQGLKSGNNILSKGELLWKNNWVSFMDTLMQFHFLAKHETRDFRLPTKIQYLSIDPQKHLSMKNDSDIYEIKYYSDLNSLHSGGIELRDITWSLSTRRQQMQAAPHLENYSFIPYDNSNSALDPNESQFRVLSILFQIVKENLQVLKLRGVEVYSNVESLIAPTVVEVLLNEPQTTYDFGVATSLPIDANLRKNLQQLDVKTIMKEISVSPVGQDLHFVIAENVLSKNNSLVLSNLISSINPEGFIILNETEEIDSTLLDNFGMTIASKQVLARRSFILLKKKKEKRNAIVIKITEKNFMWLSKLKSALKESEQTGINILLVSQGEPELGIVGLMNCIRQDSEVGNNIAYVFIQDKNAPDFNLEDQFYSSQLEKQLMSNIFKDNKWGSYRHLWLKNLKLPLHVETNHAYVNTLTRGDLSSLQWIEGPLKFKKLDKNRYKELCEVYYAPLNIRDLMIATGNLSLASLPENFIRDEGILGLEFAGINSRGQRIMGMLPAKGLATTVIADKDKLMWQVPEVWSLREAATIPVSYSTSYFALFVRGNLKPGESILIHVGSDGVGLASISIALHTGCHIFATVDPKARRGILKKMFPQLKDNCIGNSMDISFEQVIKRETNGEGVDIVLNSSTGDVLKASVRCLKEGGRYLEIGKLDLSNEPALEMSFILKNLYFHVIRVDLLFKDNYITELHQVAKLVLEGISNGAVKPLPSAVFKEHQLEHGFRFLESGEYIGKVLIEIRHEDTMENLLDSSKKIIAVSRTYFHPDKSYILVGGLGGFGMELAHWMISRGVKFIVLISRSGVKTGYQEMWIRRWKKSGIKVLISTEDVTKMNDCDKLIAKANRIAPVGGIFNLAVVLHNDIIGNLSEQHFLNVTRPKIDATRNLDIVSRRSCLSLDYFVVFSSVTSGRGLPGQTNYGLANSAMERLVEKRRKDGLPGLGIQWGAIGDVGLVIETMKGNETVVGGTIPQRIYSCLNVMDTLLKNQDCFVPIVSSLVLEDKRRFKKSEDSNVCLVDVIGNILGIKNIKTVNQKSSFLDLGLDSLITTEIKQTLERTYDIVMSIPEIRSLNFDKLKEIQDKGSPKNIAQNDKEDFDTYEQELEALTLVETELAPKEVVVGLNSDKNCNGDPVFFIHVPNMKEIAKRINKPAYGLQCTSDIPFSTIGDLAKYYINAMKKIQSKGPYTVIAYSFGTIIALEIGLMMEAAEETVVLKLIDGSIDFVLFHLKAIDKYFEKKHQLSDDFKRKTLSFFLRRLNPKVNFLKVFDALSQLEDEEEMLDKLVEFAGAPQFHPDDIKSAALLSYKKLSAARKHSYTGTISAPILLIKASLNFMTESEDYGLSKICKGAIEIRELAGNHLSIVSGRNVDSLVQCLNI